MKQIMFILILVLSTIHIGVAQDAKEIIKKAIDKMEGNSNQATMTMKIVRPKWTREITMESWASGNDYSLILIKSPERDKGTAFLKREQELWNWQPSIDRTIKLPPSMMMQSWMGSDFTNDDLVKQSSIEEDYDHELVGDTVVSSYESWKIVLTPREDAAVVWGKVEAYISKEDFFQLLFKYYDEDGFLVNTMNLSEIKLMDGREIPTVMEMIPADDPQNKTIIIYHDMKFDIPIDKDFFSIQQMKRVR